LKKIYSIIAGLFLVKCVFAQAPNKMSYQAVIRDNSNALVTSQIVGMQISILQTSASGTAVYVETQTPTTNANGLASIEIGGGTMVSGSFANINWANGPYFIKTETDPAGGTNYTVTGTSQLLSVPYALFSSNGFPSGGANGQVLTMCNGIPTWTNGGQCPSAAGSISALNCGSATNSGALASGTSASGVSSNVPYTGGNGGTHNGQTVTSTGVTGLTATLTAGTFANGSGSLTYTFTGTPASSGMASFALNIGGQSCTLNRTVNTGGSTGSNASCGADSVHNPNLTYGSMTDQDGNVYKTIVIGTQEWMAENLIANHYRNGVVIPLVTDATTWNGLSAGASCWYNNDSSTYVCPYGRLYNWYAVVSSNNVCPVGWHVPTDAEWTTLETQLGGFTIAGGKMKSIGTQYWLSPNTAADNSSGFSGLPGGYRIHTGLFSNFGAYGHWWSSTEINTANAWNRALNYTNGALNKYSNFKINGFFVRCLRD
jgi:uncharacterized protein (TIGR02145 family)